MLSNGKRGSLGWTLPQKVKGCKVARATDHINGVKRKVVAFTAPGNDAEIETSFQFVDSSL